MHSIRIFSGMILLLSLLPACKSGKTSGSAAEAQDAGIYRASVTQVNDLLHTRLELKPDFARREMKGRAYLTIEPHAYPVDSLILDAVHMRIENVGMLAVAGSAPKPLSYRYDSLKLYIALDRRYGKAESYTVVVDYVAQPEKISSKGSSAISGRKGLYFINHDGKEAGKPTQLWTQGETQAASCWFPTIDAPNQKTSQELSVEVSKQYKTISNGLLLRSEYTTDSSRTDYWKQDKPHAPYLFALIVGDFAEVKDSWNKKPVHYFVEPAYAPYARLVFGNTPEMLSFYSDILGYAYPWDKYHQVVVRDFVSGAMENTGCVVHFDKLQHDAREHLDETYEDIVAHELFHHWFGDLLTCESWSNVPLNESFATYGEYLWNEYKYGRSEADMKLAGFHESYFGESTYKSENLIRYNYKEQEDMFDAHSYQKGGSVLHMLRKYTGDAVFFESLKRYLHNNQYKTVELSDLRKAFEDVSGEDLNWFFNQWFLDKGHPQLDIRHTYDAEKGYRIVVMQKEKTFKLPFDIDVVNETGTERMRVILTKDTQEIRIPAANEKSYVQFDAENQLLCIKEEQKPEGHWERQFSGARLAAHKLEAFEQLMLKPLNPELRLSYCKQLLADTFWYCRMTGIGHLNTRYFSPELLLGLSEQTKSYLKQEPVAAVRRTYVSLLLAQKDEASLEQLLNDSSYDVVRRSLTALAQLNQQKAYQFASSMRSTTHRKMQTIVYSTIARYSPDNEMAFFIEKIANGNSENVGIAAGALGAFMLHNRPGTSDEALKQLEAMAGKTGSTESVNAIRAIRTLHSYYYYQVFYMQMAAGSDKSKQNQNKNKAKLNEGRRMYQKLDALIDKYKR